MILDVNNLIKRYKETLAIDNVSFSVNEGEIFGLLGPNGAGKTTLINSIISLLKIDKGEIFLFGKNIKTNEKQIKKYIGIVPQDIAVYTDLTAYENLMLFGKLYGLKGNELEKSVTEALEFTGLTDRKNDFPKNYSGGMKRRLNIACALVHKPKLIIMDEPTVGIDTQSRNHILQSVKELNKAGTTIIYTSHYIEEVEEICTNICIMDNGRIIAKGTTEELRNLVNFEEKITLQLSSVNYTIVDNIKKQNGVKDCTIDDSIGCRKIQVISEKNSRNLSKIIDCISNENIDILSIEVDKPNLERVFLTLTGKNLRD